MSKKTIYLKNKFTYLKHVSTERFDKLFKKYSHSILISEWFPTIGQQIIFQEVAVSAKYFTTK